MEHDESVAGAPIFTCLCGPSKRMFWLAELHLPSEFVPRRCSTPRVTHDKSRLQGTAVLASSVPFYFRGLFLFRVTSTKVWTNVRIHVSFGFYSIVSKHPFVTYGNMVIRYSTTLHTSVSINQVMPINPLHDAISKAAPGVRGLEHVPTHLSK